MFSQFRYKIWVINKYVPLFSSKCFYSINDFHQSYFECGDYSSDEHLEIIHQLWSIRVNKLVIRKELSSIEIKIIKDVISSINFKSFWREINIMLETLKDAIEILDLLSGCQRLEYAYLKYATCLEITSPKEEISLAKGRFHKKADIFCKVSIKCVK